MRYLCFFTHSSRSARRFALRLLAGAVAACAFMHAPSAFVSAADWPAFRGNYERTGFTAEQAYPPLTWRWNFQVQGDVISSPVVYEGIVYVGGRSGGVYAVNAVTGELIWDYSSDGWVDATPAVSSTTVFVPSRDGNLYALDRFTGDLLWQAPLGAGAVSSPLVLAGRIYVGTGIPQNKLKVFDARTGAFLWAYQAGQPVDAAPSTDGSLVFFGSNDGKTYAVAPFAAPPPPPASPAVWEHPTTGFYGIVSIGVSSPSVYAVPSRETGKLYKLTAAGGAQTGVFEPFPDDLGVMEMEVTSPVLARGKVYYGAGTAPHGLYALSMASLEPVWTSTPSLGNTSVFGYPAAPSMANEIIYAATADQRLLAISSSSVQVQEISLGAPSHTSPAVSNGYVYVGTMGGDLIAYKAEKATALSYPKTLDIIQGTTAVRGYLWAPALAGYRLEYVTAADPDNPVLISSAALTPAGALENGLLGTWDTALRANGSYTLRLTLLESGSVSTDNTAEIVVRVNHPPLPPAGLTAADRLNDSGNAVELSWSPSVGAVSYNIYRNSGGDYALLASTAAAAFTDRAAATGTTFTYMVRAWDGWVESADSSTAAASAVNNNPSSDAVAPARTTDLSAAPGASGGQVLLSWTAPGNDELTGTAASYAIRYSTVSSFNFAAAAAWNNARAVAGAAGTAETELVTGLSGGVTYYFALSTADLIPNASTTSNIASAWAQRDFVPPGAPSGLAAADTPGDAGGSLTLTWALSPDDGTGAGDVYGYKIYRGLASGAFSSTAPYASVGKGVGAYRDDYAPDNMRFYYAAAAFDSTNNSVLSNEAAAISADNYRFLDPTEGGSLRLEDGAQLVVPRDAISQGAYIIMQKVDPATFLPSARVKANSGVRPTSVVYEIKFSTTSAARLIKNVMVTLPYADTDVAGMSEKNLRMYTAASAGDTWLLLDTSRVEEARNIITAEVSHFSLFRVMEYVPGGALISAEAVYTYPNPAKGSRLTFKFRPAYEAFIKIDVYNVAGEKVARFEKAGCQAGVTSEIQWDIDSIASGVYVYIVEAASAAGTKTITKKLAIIH